MSRFPLNTLDSDRKGPATRQNSPSCARCKAWFTHGGSGEPVDSCPFCEAEYAGKNPPNFRPEGRHKIEGRGVVVTGRLIGEPPWTEAQWLAWHRGETRFPTLTLHRRDGKVWKVSGLEKFATARALRVGDPIGLLLGHIEDEPTSGELTLEMELKE